MFADALVGGGEEDRGGEAPALAGGVQGRRGIELAHARVHGRGGVGHRRGRVAPHGPQPLRGVGVEDPSQLGDGRRHIGRALDRHVGTQGRSTAALANRGVAVAVPGVVDHFEADSLLAAHPGSLDRAGQDVVALRADDDVGHALGGDVVHAAVATAGVPGEVGRAAQHDGTQAAVVHERLQALPSGGAAVGCRGVTHAE